MRILFIGDIVGRPGQEYVATYLQEKLSREPVDLVVANGENATHGRGLNRAAVEFLYDAGVEMITLGNHTWDQRDIFDFIDGDKRIIRPANYPDGTPGAGWQICKVGATQVLVINLMGRTFLSQLDCPFRTVDAILAQHKEVKHVLVDMHAETTSEKLAMGWHLDGRVSAVVGTHTHVQTGDERVMPGGTAYISDVGMVGPRDGILGMDRELVMRRMMTHLPVKFQVAEGARQFSAVLIDVCDETGRAKSIQRIYEHEGI